MMREVVIFALLGVAFASPSANQYVQNVIQTSLTNEIMRQGLNPARLSPFSAQFSNQGLYDPKYKANFTNGSAKGFNQVRIRTDCQGPRNYSGESSINCTLALTRLTIEYNVRILNGSQAFNFKNVEQIEETLVDVNIVSSPRNRVGTVRNYGIKMGGINPTFVGMPRPFLKTSLYELIITYKSHLSFELMDLIKYNFIQALRQALAQKPMPRQ